MQTVASSKKGAVVPHHGTILENGTDIDSPGLCGSFAPIFSLLAPKMTSGASTPRATSSFYTHFTPILVPFGALKVVVENEVDGV